MINNEFFSEELISKIVNDIGVAFWVWNMKTKQLYYNHAFYNMLGYEVVNGATDLDWWKKVLHPDDRGFVIKEFDDFISGKIKEYNIKCRVINQNGDVMWMTDTGKFTEFDENGKPVLFVGTCHDITERRSYEEKLKLAMEFADFSIWECDIETQEVFFEDDYLKTLGYDSKVFDSNVKNWFNIVHPDDFEISKKELLKCFKGETTKYNKKTRIKKANGDYIYVRDIGEVVKFSADGKPLKMLGSRINITHQENSRLKLKEQQEKLKMAMSFADFSIWECDIPSNKVSFEDDYLSSLGYKDDYFDSNVKNWLTLTHKDDLESATETLMKCFRGEIDVYNQKSRVKKGDGEYIWIRDIGKVVSKDSNGKPLKMLGGRINITQQENSRQKLKEQQEKLKMAMEFADFSIWEWDVNLNQVTHDDKYIETLGYDKNEFDNDIKNWLDIIHDDDIVRVKKHLDLCFKGLESAYDQKLRIRKGNGEYIWVHDVGKISQSNIKGIPIKIIGGRVNINELETSKLKLENYQKKLEDLIKQRTKDLLRRDTILLELNQMSQKLMATPQGENFNNTVYECLNEFSVVGENSRFSIFRHKSVEEPEYCYLASNNKDSYKNEFTRDMIHDIFKDISISYASDEAFNENSREEFYAYLIEKMSNIELDTINYKNEYPTIFEYVSKNKILNAQTCELTPKELIFTKLQGVQSILVAPITIANEPWGFIILDYFETKVFTEDDEKMLELVGSVLAQAIHKNELEIFANEAIEHNRLMLDSIPMCCNLWLDGKNVSTNAEAVRLFDLENQEQYLENFSSLSPEYQPNGEKSKTASLKHVNDALETGFKRFEWMHQNLNGEEIPCEITLVRIPLRGKFYVSSSTIDMRKIKEVLRNYEETQKHLEEAHEEAVLSSKAKSNFLANMSHEIRTPMNAISGMTDIIIRDTNNSDIKDYAKNIKRASDSLLSIINDVLDISKIESGKLDIVEGEYDLSDTLNDILNIANNRLQDKNLLFVTNFQHDLPCRVIGDDIRVKQIIINILNNAIKFTESGSITFDVKGEFNDGVAQLTFSVTDTGIGISKEDIKKLFIEFERVNTTKNRTIEGTGLGLAISKRLCEMMNGFFKVESELGKGSAFSVTIFQKYTEYSPLAQIKEEKLLLIFESRDLYLNSIKQSCTQLGLKNTIFCSSQSEFNEALHQQTFDFIFTTQMYLSKVQEMMLQYKLGSKIVLLADNDSIKSKYDYTTIVLPTNTMDIANIINGKSSIDGSKSEVTKFVSPDAKILIVDDNTVNLKVAQGLLSPYKAKIETAENGKEAVEKIKNNKYDLVFMDHMMPVMDGIDATIAIRSIDEDYFKNLPIIALTANAIVGTKEMFISEGMNDFIAKPIKLSALNETLAKWLPVEKRINHDELVKNNDYIKAIECEKNNVIDIKGIDSKLGINRIGGDFDTYIDIVKMYHKDGLKRIVNIVNLFETNQLLDFKIEVHALKSASASIGAIEVSKLASLLEEAININDEAYVRENTQQFLDEFNELLQNIEISIKDLIGEDNETKEVGDIFLINQVFPKLSNALDNIDIAECENLLEVLIKFSWNEKLSETITKIKDSIDSYEFDEAIEIIENYFDD